MTDVDSKLAALLASARAAAKTAEQAAEMDPDGRRVDTLETIMQAADRIDSYAKDAQELVSEANKKTIVGLQGMCKRLGQDMMLRKISLLFARTLVVSQKMTRPGSISLFDFPLLAEEWDLSDRAEKDPETETLRGVLQEAVEFWDRYSSSTESYQDDVRDESDALLKRMRDAIGDPKEMPTLHHSEIDGWRSMDTAPKDGTEILLKNTDGKWRWTKHLNGWINDSNDFLEDAGGWKPVPKERQ